MTTSRTAVPMATQNRVRWLGVASLLGCALVLSGCASMPADPAARAAREANHDPFEATNRKIFAFNEFVDRSLIKPVAKGYRRVLPGPVRDALRHLLDNLYEPLIFGNDILQGRLKAARTTGCRFLMNSTVGFAGLTDVASEHKLPKQTGDFGQTLWTWGFPEGPYLVLPVFGPSNPRDGIGSGVDAYLDPVRLATRHLDWVDDAAIYRITTDGIDIRSRNIDSLDEMQKEAVDYYASFRSLFRQHREAELSASGPGAARPPPDFYQDSGDAAQK